jgi:hypothetical protein
MSTLRIKLEPLASGVTFPGERMLISLVDGRELAVPLNWFPRLQSATDAQRSDWRLIGGGIGIHWPTLDEDISVENLLFSSCASKASEE